MEMVEDEDEDPGEQDQELHRDLEKRVEEQGQPALREAPAREVALDLALVAAEVAQGQEEPADEPAPERVGLPEVPRGVHDLEVARERGHGQRVAQAEALGELGDRHPHADEDAEPDDGHLHHVGPHHRLVPAVDHVNDRGAAHEQDRARLAPTQDHGEHDRGGIEGDPHREPPREQEQEAGEGAGARIEALLQVLIGGVDAGPVEERDQGRAEDDHREGQSEIEDDEAHPLGVGLARSAHEGDGADLGGHHGEAGRPPAHLPVRQEEVVDPLVPPAHPEAEAHDGDEVDAEDRPVEGSQ